MLLIAAALSAGCSVTPVPPDGSGGFTGNTWSIVGVDSETREVGVALATCLSAKHSIAASMVTVGGGSTNVYAYSVSGELSGSLSFELARLVAGVGVIVAQARVDAHNADRLDQATAELLAGSLPERIIGHLTSNDPMFEERQYGLSTLDSLAAGFTGSAAIDWAGSLTGEDVSVQGNILVGPEVVGEALAAFRDVRSRPQTSLGDALMGALEAGAAQGGDKRCPKGQAALTAFIVVARADDAAAVPHLWLAAPPQRVGEAAPVQLLREEYDRMQGSEDRPPEGGEEGRRVVWWMVGFFAALAATFVLWTTGHILGRRKRR